MDPVQQQVLLQRVAKGEEGAFAELIRTYRDTIFGQAMAFTKSREASEELMQDIFLKVWSQRSELPELTNFEGWLFIMARNKVYDYFKKRISKPIAATVPDDLVPSAAPTPDQQTEGRDAYRILLEGIALLPEKRQQVFRMSRLEGMKNAEIARELGMRQDTVYEYLVKALNFLKDHLSKQGVEPILLIILLNGM